MKRTLAAVILAAVILAAGMIAAPSAPAQDKGADVTDMQALRLALKADKKALVAATLALTPTEAKKFWPIYENYRLDQDTINRRRIIAVEGLIGQDKPVSDLYARNLANELIATDEAEIRARRSFQGKLMRALPAKKVARYLQLEFKIRAVMAYDIAATIPLIK